MSRRIVVLGFTLFLLLGTMTMVAPTSSAAGGWTTLSRHCWVIHHRSDRLKACTSIKGGVVDDQFMIRTRCRVKFFTFEPPSITLSCNLYDQPALDLLASARSRRSGVGAIIVKSPLVLCDPSLMYWGLGGFDFRYPDGSPGAYGLAVDWFNESACSPPA